MIRTRIDCTDDSCSGECGACTSMEKVMVVNLQVQDDGTGKYFNGTEDKYFQLHCFIACVCHKPTIDKSGCQIPGALVEAIIINESEAKVVRIIKHT